MTTKILWTLVTANFSVTTSCSFPGSFTVLLYSYVNQVNHLQQFFQGIISNGMNRTLKHIQSQRKPTCDWQGMAMHSLK